MRFKEPVRSYRVGSLSSLSGQTAATVGWGSAGRRNNRQSLAMARLNRLRKNLCRCHSELEKSCSPLRSSAGGHSPPTGVSTFSDMHVPQTGPSPTTPQTSCAVWRHNRPISAHSQGVGSLRASAAIFVRRLERRSRQRRVGPTASVRRNISSAC